MIKVWVIDDEPLIGSIVESYLKKIAVVVKFDSATLALNEFKNSPPDLIISDFYMPEMTGLELVSKIRNDKHLTPVILMSGSHVQDNEISQFTAFIKKPMSPKDLQALVLSLIKTSEKQ